MISQNLDFTAPTGWGDLSPRQMHILFQMLASSDVPADHIPALFLFRINRVRVITFSPGEGAVIDKAGAIYSFHPDELAPLLHCLDWINEVPEFPVAYHGRNFYAAQRNETLSDLSFAEYMRADNYFQGYVSTKDKSKLMALSCILYPKRWRWQAQKSDLLLFASFWWWTTFKRWASLRWPDFLRPVKSEQVSFSNPTANIRQAVDAQIRALTKGDITKENEILSMPCHRALTELNALARESEEYKQKLKNK